MEQNHLTEAIRLISGSKCTYDTDGKTILKWKTPDVSQPSQENIDAKIVKLKAEWGVQKYARDRQAEYPTMADQLDYIFHNGVDKWKEDIVQPVKDKYPKPE